MLLPAIIFINSNFNAEELLTLQTQLFISDTISKFEFDLRIEKIPSYPKTIYLQKLRLLVILESLQDFKNRELANLVLYSHYGQLDILKNDFGTPGFSISFERVTLRQLFKGKNDCCFIPFEAFEDRDGYCRNKEIFHIDGYHKEEEFFHRDCGCEQQWCDKCHVFSGLKKNDCCSCECRNGGGNEIHKPNCENELNNIPFLNRK